MAARGQHELMAAAVAADADAADDDGVGEAVAPVVAAPTELLIMVAAC